MAATFPSKPKRGHYHCLECSSLFDATVRPTREQRCPVCGHPPTGKILAGTEHDQRAVSTVSRAMDPTKTVHAEKHGIHEDSQKIYEATLEAQEKRNKGRVKRTKRREKRSLKIPITIAVWLVLMGAVVGIFKWLQADDDQIAADLRQRQAAERRQQEALTRKKQNHIREAVPICQNLVTGFFNASSAASKSQYAYNGAKLAGTISRYYRDHTGFSSVRSTIRIMQAEWLEVDGRQVMATVCKNNLDDRFEVIFVWQGGEWKIDWLSLVKHDTHSWPLFISQPEGTEGEFRIYLRVRNLREGIESSNLSIVLYKPNTYFKSEMRNTLTEAKSIPKDSELGAQILKLHEEAQKISDPFGFTRSLDPDTFIRARATLRVTKNKNQEPTLEIVSINAAHWYGDYVDAQDKPDQSKDSVE